MRSTSGSGISVAGLVVVALEAIDREYPNQIAHVLSSPTDVAPPRELPPAFYGAYDWHSSVHSHWALVRLLRCRANAGPGDRLPRFTGDSEPPAVANEVSAVAVATGIVWKASTERSSVSRRASVSWPL